MVPVPSGAGAWHEEQIDELFASLLGKGFEYANGIGAVDPMDEDAPRVDDAMSIPLAGLRVL